MKIICIVLFLLPAFFAHAQKGNTAQERSSVGVSYGFGNGDIRTFYKSGYGHSHVQKSLTTFGLNYWHEISKNLFFETGLHLFRYTYATTSVYLNEPPRNNLLNLISVPFKLRYEAGKYLFFNGGLTADLSKGKSNKMNGIGAGIGIGLQVKTVKNISLYVNPQTNIHAILLSNRFFAESNITFGASYPIPNP